MSVRRFQVKPSLFHAAPKRFVGSSWVSRLSLPLFAGAMAFVLPGAMASGDGQLQDPFVKRSGSDLAPARYQAGELGVVLSSYSPVQRYLAWRALVLGRNGMQAASLPDKALFNAERSNEDAGWRAARSASDTTAGDDANDAPVDAWKTLRATAGLPEQEAYQITERSLGESLSAYTVCPSNAYQFALATYKRLGQRADATPARLKSWILAQDKVFSFCVDNSDRKHGLGGLPTSLADREPAYWRQLRDYQIAAAHFYNDEYDLAAGLFDTIAQTNEHPMRAWAAHSALRARFRAVDLEQHIDPTILAQRQKIRAMYGKSGNASDIERARQQLIKAETAWKKAQLPTLQQAAEKILADATYSDVHGATRALLRVMQSRLDGAGRLEQLGKLLDRTDSNPFEDDHLIDWNYLNRVQQDNAVLQTLRDKHPFADWMAALDECARSGTDLYPMDDSAVRDRCGSGYQRALGRWQKASRGGQREAQAWLVAALMLASELNNDLEQAALAVPADAPGYATVRYNLARLYRRMGQRSLIRFGQGNNWETAWVVGGIECEDKAFGGKLPRLEQAHCELQQKTVDGQIKWVTLAKAGGTARLAAYAMGPESSGTPDAGKWIDKANRVIDEALGSSWLKQLDSRSARNLFRQERFANSRTVADRAALLMRRYLESRNADSTKDDSGIGWDGVNWINTRLATEELLAIAEDRHLPVGFRTQVAVRAWMRAELLGKTELANRAAKLVQKNDTAFKNDVSAYLAATEPELRSHLFVTIALRHRFYIDIYDVNPGPDWTPGADQDITASMWCSFANSEQLMADDTQQLSPPAFDVSSMPAVRDAEDDALKNIPNATAYVGMHALRWADSHPKDADTPWLLYVTVQSTRGGCLDGNASKLSRAAFNVLHKRFPGNAWTKATKYYY